MVTHGSSKEKKEGTSMQRQLQQQQQQQQQYMPVGMPASSGYSFASNYRSNSTWSGGAASHNNGDMLVITDMQPDFAEALEARLVNKVCALVDYAMARNWVIVVLEYVGKGDTLPEIRQRLAGYTRTFTVVKQTDNGSPVVLEHCKAHQLSISHYVLCGVSINACVRKTGCGLAFSSGHPMVDFIIEACGDHFEPRWDEYPEASQIRLIP